MTSTRKYGRLNETRNYVIDLETLGLGPDAIVTSAALAQFDSKSTRLIATWTIDTKAQEDMGRVMDADTVMWWLKQSDAARESITGKEAQRRKVSPFVFLKDLFAIMRADHSARPLGAFAQPCDTDRVGGWTTGGNDNFTLWAKPQHFDIGILEHMARQCPVSGSEVCLHRRRVHNVRTALAVVNLVREGISYPDDLDETPNPGAHDAAADALVTAAVMRDALKEIEGFTGLLNVVRESMEKHAGLPAVVPQSPALRTLKSSDDAPVGSLIRRTTRGGETMTTLRLWNGRGWNLEGGGRISDWNGWEWDLSANGPCTLLAEGLNEAECLHLSGLSIAGALAWCSARAAAPEAK